MAKFITEYEIHVGDIVRFKTNSSKPYQIGIVQDITQMPDIWVEGFAECQFKRWCIGIDSLEIVISDYDSCAKTTMEIEEGEMIEFVHEGDVGTPGFGKLIYTFHHAKKNGKK